MHYGMGIDRTVDNGVCRPVPPPIPACHVRGGTTSLSPVKEQVQLVITADPIRPDHVTVSYATQPTRMDHRREYCHTTLLQWGDATPTEVTDDDDSETMFDFAVPATQLQTSEPVADSFLGAQENTGGATESLRHGESG